MGLVDDTLQRHKDLLTKKQRWLSLWQLVGEFVHSIKQSFTVNLMPGDFLNRDLFDSTGRKSNRKASAALLGMLWHNGGKTIRLQPPSSLPRSKDITEFYNEITKRTAKAIDDPRAGMSLSLEEYMNDQGALGTSGVGVDAGLDSDLLYMSYGVQNITIDEGKNGFVDTVFIERHWTIKMAIAEYGLENLSKTVQDKAAEGPLTDRIKILVAIEPRRIVSKEIQNNLNMPFRSLHIEMDGKHLIKESGFEEMPINIARFFKNNGELYGRSPGMDALPDILELNAVKEARMLAQEKALDPPLGVVNDAIAGGGVLDTSAGGTNTINVKGLIGNNLPPVFPLFSVGSIAEADKQIAELKLSIQEHFSIDRLLDFNTNVQMTLGEAQLRNQIRAQALGSIFVRQINELFTPLIERSVAIMFRAGKLGVFKDTDEARQIAIFGSEEPLIIPDEVATLIRRGDDFFDIKYFSPAVRMMEAEEASGIVETWRFIGQLAQTNPEVLDTVDADESGKRFGRSQGSQEIFRDDETIKQIRSERAQAQQRQAEIEAREKQAGTVKDLSSASKDLSEGVA